ncbi:helicase RepA family protein [Streptomyces sp. S1A]|uniref:helicase RepA family protein n=1 Tax=Streptomyces sp. ICN903 TaxID=2964654 RepID=UPI001EDA0D3D|nr:helicase RepA family protein [Streptomyces sp. ICN903]MCG3040259.1 helicase RepA family protein [Streptomyces sp. ICN903]
MQDNTTTAAGDLSSDGRPTTTSQTTSLTPAALEALDTSWRPVDLTDVLEGRYERPAPTVGARNDGVGLFYPGRMHSVSSESEGGKTWFLLAACAHEIAQGHHVIYLDFEDDAGGIVGRLLTLGVPADHIRDRFHYIRPEVPVRLDGGALWRLLEEVRPTLAVLDGITEAMTLHGLNPLDNADAAKFGRTLPRPIAALGPAVAAADHVTKSTEGRGRYSLGAVHKLNGLDGAAYVLDNRAAFGVGRNGRSAVYITKDRPGRLREHALPTKTPGIDHFGDFVMESVPEGFNDTAITAPVAKTETEFRPTVVMAKISKLLAEQPGLSKNSIETMVGGKRDIVRTALDLLIVEGCVAVEKTGRGHAHTLIRPLSEAA